MRIAVQVTVEMSPEQVAAYCAEFGVDRAEIRQDVSSYIRSVVSGSAAFGEGSANVYVR